LIFIAPHLTARALRPPKKRSGRSLRAEEEILPSCLLRRPSGAHRPAGLVPEHDDLLVGRRDDPRVHAPFVPGWLQGSQIWSKPVLSPACKAVASWTDPP
jgi:hypothetical protein